MVHVCFPCKCLPPMLECWFESRLGLEFSGFGVWRFLKLARGCSLGTPVSSPHRLAGLEVKASASGAGDPGFESHLRWDFSGSSHTSDLKIGTPVAILPGAWRYRVSAGTGQPGVSILCLGAVESLICDFYLSVAARKIA